MVEVAANDILAFINLGFDRMLAKAAVLGSRVSERPDLDSANSVFALVVHCTGVTEWWLEHVVLGRPSDRNRSAEFQSSGTMAELHEVVAQFRSTLPELVDEVVRTPVPKSAYLESAIMQDRAWPWTTASICLHVIEELFQHAGHVDITADLLSR